MPAASVRVRAMLALWLRRIRERDEMRSMDAAEQRDLVLSPGDISRETAKWFWQE